MGFSDIAKNALKKAPGKIFDTVKKIEVKDVLDTMEKQIKKQIRKKSDDEVISLSKKSPNDKIIQEEIKRRGI